MIILMKPYLELRDIFSLKEFSNKSASSLWICTVISFPLTKSTLYKKLPMLTSTNIFGTKQTNEDYSRIGSNLAMSNLHHYYSINIVKVLTIYMEFGTAAKANP